MLQAIKLAAERVEKLSLASEEAAAADDAAMPDAGAEEAPAAAPRSSKRRRTLQTGVLDAWRELHAAADGVERQLRRGDDAAASAPVFAFVEGALVSALREGTWILLDEVNLAPSETLERLAGVLEARTPLPPRPPLSAARLRDGIPASVNLS